MMDHLRGSLAKVDLEDRRPARDAQSDFPGALSIWALNTLSILPDVIGPTSL